MVTIRRVGRAATVLLIDDNAGVRAGVRALLSGEAALRVVGEANNGRDGLDRARELRPELIVLDQEMPGLSGVQILPALRLMLPASRVTFFTLSVEVEALALALGATAVVAKEEPALLLATLRRLAAEGGRPAPEVQVPRPPGPHPVR